MFLSLNLKYTRECLKLALPVMLTQLGQVSVNLFDNMMVGNMLGANALASTALANSVFFSFFIFAVGFSPWNGGKSFDRGSFDTGIIYGISIALSCEATR